MTELEAIEQNIEKRHAENTGAMLKHEEADKTRFDGFDARLSRIEKWGVIAILGIYGHYFKAPATLPPLPTSSAIYHQPTNQATKGGN